jgi:sugar O-acyltransferase (sialic acid O-acetyltransferase NeuD family)
VTCSLNSQTRTLVIVGAGGLGTEFGWVAEAMNVAADRDGAARPWQILGYADDASEKRGKCLGRYLVHGTIQETAEKFAGQDVAFAVAVGDNYTREKLVHAAEIAGWCAATLVHPSVILADDASIGAGTYIAPGCVVCPRAQVGNHVIVNTHVSIGHDSVLEDYAQICPGARISGGCRIGKQGFLGSNASLTPGVAVGCDAVVGANSHAVRTVPPGVTVVGCPARVVCGPTLRGQKEIVNVGIGDRRHG